MTTHLNTPLSNDASNTVSTNPPARHPLLTLGLIVSLLVLPFVIAAGLFFGGWKPAHTGQHGQLHNPPTALPASGLVTPERQAMATAELEGKWLLLLSGSGNCNTGCRQRIDEMRRVQVSLNKEMGRLRRLVVTDLNNLQDFSAARLRQPDLLLLSAPPDWLTAPENGGYRLHIIDPQGRRVLTYPPDTNAKEVRADLERLLKFSWNG